MAIYHLHLQIITRGDGKSAVAAAAYRSGEKLTNEYDGEVHDYTRKGGVVRTEILLPGHAPREFVECQSGSLRSVLWNAVEKAETQSNSQLAREMDMALPYELTSEQNIELVRDYVNKNFVAAGMCADVAIHDPDKDTPNPHAHIMLTMRPLNPDGTWGQKVRKINGKRVYTTDWNDRGKSEVWRAAWADAVNETLERYGHAERIDHRSYKRQGIEQIPTVHLGVSATQMERRGVVTDRGNINREIAMTNSEIRQIRARINKVKAWLDENKANTPPTLYEVLSEILNSGGDKTQSKRIADLKLAAKTLVFIQHNNIGDLPALADKVSALQRDCNDAYDRKKKTERRVKTLDKHIKQSENFEKYRKVRRTYDRLYAEYKTASKEKGLFSKSKAQKALDTANDYYNAHNTEIVTYDTAKKYLKDVLQERFDPNKLPPVTAWRKERDDCARELGGINSEYRVYKNEVENAEAIKRFAVKLMIPDEPKDRQRHKNRNQEVSM